VKLGNFAPRPKQVTNDEIQTMLLDNASQIDPLAPKTLTELTELEDEVEEDFMAKYRKKRLEELRKHQKGKYGKVCLISKKEYIREVNEASQEGWVCLHLAQEYVPTSLRLSEAWKDLAARFTNIKFAEGVANKIVEYFPDASVPAIFLYKDGECQHQIIGAEKVGGTRVNGDSVEWLLATYGVVKTDLEGDPLLFDEEDLRKIQEKKDEIEDGDDSDREDDRGFSQLRIGQIISK